jgi:hypothetical protein
MKKTNSAIRPMLSSIVTQVASREGRPIRRKRSATGTSSVHSKSAMKTGNTIRRNVTRM